MRKFFLLYLLFLAISLSAQEDTVFFNRDWKTTSKDKATYYRVLTELERGDYWQYKDFYLKNDSLQNVGFFSELNPNIHDSTCVWYHDNGRVSQKGIYKNDSAIGVWEEYYDNGQIKAKGDRNRYKIGNWTRWYKSGNLFSTAEYDTSGLTGEKVWYFDAKDQVRRTEFYRENVLDSFQTEYYENGTKKYIKSFSKGIQNGTHEYWYHNGQKKYSREYISGIEQDSLGSFWDKNGQISTRKEIFDPKEDYSLLWKITGNGIKEPSYLFGTMHVREKTAFDFTDTMISIFNSCEAYTMEIHPDSLYQFNLKPSDKGFISKTPIGVLNQRYHSESSYVNYRWITSLNSVFHRVGNNPDPMPYFIDAYLYSLALKRGKKGMGLETIEDHVTAGKDLPYYRKYFDILSEFNPDEEMMEVYKSGDIEKIGALSDFLSSKEFNYHILTKRNLKMADMIDSLAHCHSTFNTCGCAHLPNEDGVIQLLRDKGYNVQRIQGEFNGNKFNEYTNQYALEYNVVKDQVTGGEVTVLGNPIKINFKGHVGYSVMNMIDEVGFLFVPIDYMLDTLDLGKGNFEEVVEQVVGGDAADYVLKVDKHKKGRYSIWFDIEDQGVTLHNRILVYPKLRKLALVQSAYWEKSGEKVALSKEFLNTVTFCEVEIEENDKEWVEVSDTISAFRVLMPKDYQLNDYKGQIYSAFDANNEYYIHTYESYGYQKDSSSMLEVLEYAEKAYGVAKKKKMVQSLYSSEFYWQHELNTGAKVYYKVIKRGTKFYILSAVSKNKFSDTEKFMNSFKLLEFRQLPLEKYSSEIDSVSINVPNSKEVKPRFVTGSTYFKDGSNKKNSYRGNYNNYSSESWYYEEDEESLYFSETDYSKYKREPRRYEFTDTSSGINLTLTTHRYRDLYFLDTGLEDRYDRYSRDYYWYGASDTIYKTIVKDSNTFHIQGQVERENRNTGLRYDMIIKGNHLFELQAVYPLEIDSSIINNIFNSFDLTRVPDTIDMVKPEFDLILKGLQSSDSLVQEKTTGALKYTEFPIDYNRKIEELILLEMKNDTNEIFNNEFDLLEELSSNPDDSVELFLQRHFNNNVDSLEEKVIVLRVLSQIPTESSTNFIYMNLPDSMATSGEFEGDVLIDILSDSNELINSCFDAVSKQLSHKTLGGDILDELKYYLKQDSVLVDSILFYRNRIDTLFISTVNEFVTLNEDSSSYFKVKNKLKDLTAIVENLPSNQVVIDHLKKLVESEVDVNCKTSSALALLKLKNPLSKEYWDNLYEKSESKFDILSSLIKNNARGLLSEKYQTQEEFAKQQLNDLGQNYYSKKSFEKMKLYKRYKKEVDGIKQYFYAFTYYKGNNRVRYIGISAGQPLNQTKLNAKAVEVVGSKKYESEDNVKELINELFDDFMRQNKEKREEAIYSDFVEATAESIEEVVEE